MAYVVWYTVLGDMRWKWESEPCLPQQRVIRDSKRAVIYLAPITETLESFLRLPL